MGTKICTLYSRITTSMTKMTAAKGVLNAAAIPAAIPQPDNILKLLKGNFKYRPT